MLLTLLLETILESPLDCKEIQPVPPKGNQSWIFTRMTDAKALILWSHDMKSWLLRKDPDAGKHGKQEKGETEDEMVGWHHHLNGHEFEQALGVGNGQRSLACCSPWGHKESDMTEWLSLSLPIQGEALEGIIVFDISLLCLVLYPLRLSTEYSTR